jgi:TolB protein
VKALRRPLGTGGSYQLISIYNISMPTDWENQLILARFQVDLRLPGAEEAYRAWDNQTNQAVSLHILPETDEEARRLLESRIRDLERVSHPGILPYLGLFEFSGQSFWAEGYVDGPSLRFALNAAVGQPLPLSEALIYLKSLSSELAALHTLGWAHTKLQPESVRLDRHGTIYLSGLFSAQRLGASLSHAPEPYNAPEETISSASDVYALASILFEMLAGTLPSATPLPDLRQLNPDVPEFLARALPRALEENPADRIANATEFFLTICMAAHVEAESVPEHIPSAADTVPSGSSPTASLLETWNYLPPIVPPPSATTRPFDREKRRLPLLSWLVTALLGLVAVVLVVWYFSSSQNQAPQQLAMLPTSAASLVPTNPTPTAASLTFPTSLPVPTINAPDGLGGRIVFTCTRGDLNQLCMVAPTGGEISRVTAESAHDFYPTFSADGGLLLFASNRDGHYNLYLKLLANDILTQLTTGLGEVSSASFSPDGLQVAFSNSVDGKPSSLWIIDHDGKNPHMLYEGTGNIAGPVWSPNGKSIAFAMSSAANLESYEVYIMDVETKTIGPVTKGTLSNTGGSVDWSPDGRFLLLFAGPSGNNNIFTFEIVSGAIKQLTDGGNNAAPAYSPDGRWIVFNSQRKNDTANIFIMRVDGSDVRQLTNDTEPDWQPRWGR